MTRDDVNDVVTVSRRKIDIDDAKLTQLMHLDFNDFSALESDLGDVDVCFYCVGVYQGQVSKSAFFQITCDYQLAFLDSLARTSPGAVFVLFGAQGADPTEKSWAPFARAKGRAENQLTATDFPRKHIFRPGYIHPTGGRRPAGTLYRLFVPVAEALRQLFGLSLLTDRDLAAAMVAVGMNASHPSGILENDEIKTIAAAC